MKSETAHNSNERNRGAMPQKTVFGLVARKGRAPCKVKFRATKKHRALAYRSFWELVHDKFHEEYFLLSLKGYKIIFQRVLRQKPFSLYMWLGWSSIPIASMTIRSVKSWM
jgi:hypothetical protein